MANDDLDLATFAVASHIASMHDVDAARAWNAADFIVRSGRDLRSVFADPFVISHALGFGGETAPSQE